MRADYSNVFNTLVKSYYNGNFEKAVENLLNNCTIDKIKFENMISSLCGVDVNHSGNYINDLKIAIGNYDINHKIVNKISPCKMDCIKIDGKTSCQKSCPFDAILIDNEKHTTYIDSFKCTDCGFCIEACPDGNLLDKAEFIPLINLLRGNSKVIATVAPAIIGQFGENVTTNQLRSAFIKVGFFDMVEVAFFADMLTLKEAVEFDHHVKNKDDLMITSCCCPMWVGMLRRIYVDLIKYVSPSISPMIASGKVLKTLNPNCKIVFIGPCVAKKAEAKEKDILGSVDYVLTFAELKEIFDALHIIPEEMEECPSVEYSSKGGRLYARTGGVSIAVGEAIEKLFPEKHKLFNAIQVDGVKNCRELLEKAKIGTIDANFVEGMGCIGGCVGGPKALLQKDEGQKRVNAFAEESEIKVAVDSSCMNEILHKLDINALEDFKDANKIQIFEREF